MENFLLDPIKNLKPYKELLTDIKKGLSPISTFGIIDESMGHILSALCEESDQILVITYNDIRARRIYEDIKGLGDRNVHLLSKRELTFYDVDAISYEGSNDRLNIISKLVEKQEMIVVASIESMLDKYMSPEIFLNNSREIKVGEEIDLDRFVNDLVHSGYERVQMVEGIGQFSLRGGIFDFFTPDNSHPYRVELFDNEIDSIRTFDILTQRSVDIIDVAKIIPTNEILTLDKYRQDLIEGIDRDLNKSISKGHLNEMEREKVTGKFNKYKNYLEEGLFISNRNLLIPYIPSEYLASITDYFSDESLVFVDEPKRVEASIESIDENFNFKFTDLFSAGEILSSHLDITYSYSHILEKIRSKSVIANSAILSADNTFKPKAIRNFSVKGMQSYHNKLDLLKEDLDHLRYRGYKIVILSGTEERGERLKKNLFDMGMETTFSIKRDSEIKSSQVFITPGSIEGGFEYPDIKFIVMSDKEVFGAAKSKAGKKKKSKGKSISLSDLNVGDYVVHENHGIGRYEGVERIDIQGIKKDYLTIRYKGHDKLYVLIDQMHLVQKYIGGEAGKPKVNKLSSIEWSRTKERARRAVEDMAKELLELYAKREDAEGFQFSEDNEWQRQFEDLFPYEETEGQNHSIEEIKEDMHSAKPMDRLLCGDVGYGKTEVALRAAFKAILDGKQVAFLVPTTILAEQHYNTMMDRFSTFPIKIGVLSRFVKKSAQNLTIENIRKGLVDVVVGTHRLLSDDIKFKDLGLLIIDEEQRFGVKHKEKLKVFKEDIDVLTLTATPIPRTLHMSLSGVRDMSVIEDPPEERYPVQTYVVEYNEQMIRDAILKEVSRGGQIYYVYNRVDTIDRVTSKLRELVPEASFGIAHGQMSERQLEKEMKGFLEKQIDVLVCTTIIETGLDIPNVNTIIIYDADKMGLSQLYQLRGRVGRSNRIAYGYFTYQKDKVLSEVAEKRLRAIKEFTEFGSGFKIAMRDLEIRGAGNLLGHQQHGHMDAIGYDLYVKYLNEAIKKLKGEKVEETLDTTVDIRVDGYIKSNYIEDEEQKIEIYKKISSISDIEEYRELVDELIDRFGDIPREVENLLDVSFIRRLASKNGIYNIIQKGDDILIEFNLDSNPTIGVELVHYLSGEYGRRMKFDLSEEPSLTFKPSADTLISLKDLVEKINSFNLKMDEI